jgi:HSP20 family protein
MDIRHDEKANTVTAIFDLPGLRKEDVTIDIHNNILSVSGETMESAQRDEEGYALRERRYGKFSRSLSMPQGTKVRLLYQTLFVRSPTYVLL